MRPAWAEGQGRAGVSQKLNSGRDPVRTIKRGIR